MSIETYEKDGLDEYVGLEPKERVAKNIILMISQNSTDIFLINKLLSQLGNFKIYEAASLNAALKIISSIELDLIIVDDILSNVDGYEIVKRLNRNSILKNVPKVLLLTQGYQAKLYDNAKLDNLDFIKKPIDGMIFKTRIHSILKNQRDKFNSGSLFENMIDSKINGAKEFLKIYKSFLDIDQNLLFIYDKDRNEILEYNKNFTKFFGEYLLLNRIISNDKLMDRFVPKMSDPNYLNAHDFHTWIDLITSVKDFNFIITLKKRNREYSFNVLANKMKLFDKNMYIIKLSNHSLYLPAADLAKKYENKNIDIYLEELNSLINGLTEKEKRDKIEKNIVKLLNELNIKSPYFSDEKPTDKELTNIYSVVAKSLKDRTNGIKIRLNDKEVTKYFDENFEIIYANISSDAISDMLRGILDSYHDDKILKVDVMLYKLKNTLKIEILTKSNKETKLSSTNTFINKLLKTDNSNFSNDEIYNMMPKNLKKVLDLLKADIRTHFSDGQNVFIITIPLKDKIS